MNILITVNDCASPALASILTEYYIFAKINKKNIRNTTNSRTNTINTYVGNRFY